MHTMVVCLGLADVNFRVDDNWPKLSSVGALSCQYRRKV
jgi:hypothetical protein